MKEGKSVVTKKSVRSPARKPRQVPEEPKMVSKPFHLDFGTLLILLTCLAISVVNLLFVIGASARATAMEESRNLAMDNLLRAVEGQSSVVQAAKEREAETEVILSEPTVLWSVIKFQSDAERSAIESNLIQPLTAWQRSVGVPLKAILIERKNASSENVLVRTFLSDGQEQSFLWPESGSVFDGIWMPTVN